MLDIMVMLYSWSMKVFQEDDSFIIKKAKNGFGIFTKHSFLAETVLFQVTGPYLTCDEDDDIDDEIRSNSIRYDENFYISPQGRIADFLNHSCNPNAKVVKKGKKLFLVAIKNISKNREVAIDYSTIIAADDVWTMRCKCRSKKCRGVIKDVTRLPSTIKKEYIKTQIIPEYILAIKV
jgi:uncharacterized protein